MQGLRDRRPDKITPPGTFITVPLTPPPTDKEPPIYIESPTDTKPTKRVLKVLNSLRKLRDGRFISESPWQKYKLRHEEYDGLIDLAKQEESLWGFVEDKVSYDYDSSSATLTLRMPSHFHEVFLARVVEEIQSRIRAFADTNTESQSKSKAFAQKVKHNGSCRLDLSKGGGNGDDDGDGDSDRKAIIRRDPDAMFEHYDARWPGVIIEVSYSQKRKDLPYLADDYILETNGSVSVVVGLDIDYKTKEGSISVWRPSYVTNEQGEPELEAAQTVDAQPFRDASGRPNPSPDAGLKLSLQDFAPEALTKDIPDSSFLIDSATLCQFLDKAAQRYEDTKQERGVVQHLPPGTKKRRREKTPPEEIFSTSEEDENDRHADVAGRSVRARKSDSDGSYEP